MLIVCGFAFDAHVAEESQALRQADGAAGPDESRPAHGRGTAEEDRCRQPLHGLRRARHRDRRARDGEVVVEIHGVDVYDPTTGDIRSNDTDDIACWFIDTDYNGESFFVRHAYFTGAQRALRPAEARPPRRNRRGRLGDLYRTESRPFPVPETGKIAVKVINHYGDEVMKVYEV